MTESTKKTIANAVIALNLPKPKQVYDPLPASLWIERYGRAAFHAEGGVLALCSPRLGCTDSVCNGWKITFPGGKR